MSEPVQIRAIQTGPRADELVACLGEHLGRYGATLSGSAADGLRVSAPNIDDDEEALAFVRHQLYECGSDWADYLHL
jgi:hypothetical protein